MVTRKWKQVKEKRHQNRKRRRNKWKTRLPIVYPVTQQAQFTKTFLPKYKAARYIRIVSAIPIRKVRPSEYRFSGNSQMLNSKMYILLTQVSTKSDINSTVPTSKGRFSLRQFSQNSQSVNFFGHFFQSFIQIQAIMQKAGHIFIYRL